MISRRVLLGAAVAAPVTAIAPVPALDCFPCDLSPGAGNTIDLAGAGDDCTVIWIVQWGRDGVAFKMIPPELFYEVRRPRFS